MVAGNKQGSSSRPGETGSAPDPQTGAGTAKKKARPVVPPAGATAPGCAGGASNQGSSRRQCRECHTLTPSKWYLHKTIEGAYTCDVCYRFYKNFQRYRGGSETDQRPVDPAAKPTNVGGNIIASTSPSTAATSSKDAVAAATTSPPNEAVPQHQTSPSPAPSTQEPEEAKDASEPAAAESGDDAAGGRGTKRKQSGEQGSRQRRKKEVIADDDGENKTDNQKSAAEGGSAPSPGPTAAAGSGARPGADAASLQPLQRRAAAIAAAQGIQNCAAKGGLWAKAPTGRELAHAAAPARPAKEAAGGGGSAAAAATATGTSGNGDAAGAATRTVAAPAAPGKRATNPPAGPPKRKCILCGSEESRRFVKHRETPELGVTCERCDDYFRRHKEYPPPGRTVGGGRRNSAPSGAAGRPTAAEAAVGKEETAGPATAKAPTSDQEAAGKTIVKKKASQQPGVAKKAAVAADTSAEAPAVVGPAAAAEPTGSKGKAALPVEKDGEETSAGPAGVEGAAEGKAQAAVMQPGGCEEAGQDKESEVAQSVFEGETATHTKASTVAVEGARDERGGATDEAVVAVLSGPPAEGGKPAGTLGEATAADAGQAGAEALPATGNPAAEGVAQSSAVAADGTTANTTTADASAGGAAAGPSEEGAKAAPAAAEASPAPAGIEAPTSTPAEAVIQVQAAAPGAVNAGPSGGDTRAANADDKRGQVAGPGPGPSVSEEPSTVTWTVQESEGKEDAPSAIAATVSTASGTKGNNPTPSMSTSTVTNSLAAAPDADATSGGPRPSHGTAPMKEELPGPVAVGGTTAQGEVKGKGTAEAEGDVGKKKAPVGPRAGPRRHIQPPQPAEPAGPEAGTEQREGLEEAGEGQRAQRKAAAAGVARMRQGMGASAGGKISGGGAAGASESEGVRSCYACGSTTTQSGWRRHQGGIEGKVVCKRCYDWHYRHGTYERATPAQSRGSSGGGIRRAKRNAAAMSAAEGGHAPGVAGDGSKAVGAQSQKPDPAAAASEAAAAAAGAVGPLISGAVGVKKTRSATAEGRPSTTPLTGGAGAPASPAATVVTAADGAAHQVTSPTSRKRQRMATMPTASAGATGAGDTALVATTTGPGMDALEASVREAVLSPRWRQVPVRAVEDAAMKSPGAVATREATFSPRLWSARNVRVNGSTQRTSDDVMPDAASLQSHVEAFGITLARSCEALVALEDRYCIRLLDVAAPTTPPLSSPTLSAQGPGSADARDLLPARSALRLFYERVCGSDAQLRSRHLADVIIRWLEVHAWRSPLALLLGSTATDSGVDRIAALNCPDGDRQIAPESSRRDPMRIVAGPVCPQARPSQLSPTRLRGAPTSEPPPITGTDPRGPSPVAVDRFRGVVESLAINMAQNLLALVPPPPPPPQQQPTTAESVGAANKALAEAYTAAMPHLQNAAAAALNLVLRVQGAPSRLALRLAAPGDPIPEPPHPSSPQQPIQAAGPDPAMWGEQRGAAASLPHAKLLAPAGPLARVPSSTTTAPPTSAREGEGMVAGLSTSAPGDRDAASLVKAVEWVYCTGAGGDAVGSGPGSGAASADPLQVNSYSSEQDGAMQANSSGTAARGGLEQHLRPAYLLRSVYDGGIAQWPEGNVELVRQGHGAAVTPLLGVGSGVQGAPSHVPIHNGAGEGHPLQHAASGTPDTLPAAGGTTHCAVMWVVAPGVVRRELQTLSGTLDRTTVAAGAPTGMPSVVAADTYSALPGTISGQDMLPDGQTEGTPLRADSDPAAVAAAAEAADAVCSAVAAALARGDQAQLLGAAEAAAKVVLQLVQAVTKKGVTVEAPLGAEGGLALSDTGPENGGSGLPLMGSLTWQADETKPAPLAILIEVPVVPALVVGCAASAALR